MGDAELALRSAARRGAATRITHSNARSGQGGYFCVEAPAAINTRVLQPFAGAASIGARSCQSRRWRRLQACLSRKPDAAAN